MEINYLRRNHTKAGNPCLYGRKEYANTGNRGYRKK